MENIKKRKSKKFAKIAICAVSGLSLAATVVPTALIIANKNSDECYVTVDYNVPGLENGSFKVPKQTLVSELKLEPVEGYEFKGWYKDEACTQKYLATDVITADSTIYAKLELITYAVVFPTSSYFTVSQQSAIVNYGDSLSFTITKLEGALDGDPLVTANGTTITANEGVYTIPSIMSNVYISIDGIAPQSYRIPIKVDGSTVATLEALDGTIQDAITQANLSVNDYNSCGWFLDENFTCVADLSQPIQDGITLYTKTATPEVLSFNGSRFSISDETAIDVVVPVKYHEGGTDYTITTSASNWSDSAVQTIVLPSSLNYIESYSFRDFRNLISINIPNSVIEIRECAFQNCTGLTSINIPNSVTKIDTYAFENCKGLTSINIPNSVTNMQYCIFRGCENLEYVYWNANTINTTGYHTAGSYAGRGVFDYIQNEKPVTFVVGKDVTKFSAYEIFEGTGSGYYTNILEIAKIVFEADETRTQMTQFEACIPGRTVVFDSQAIFNACNGKMYIYDETADVGPVTVYVKQTLTGAGNFVAADLYNYTEPSSYIEQDAMPNSYTYTTSAATLVTEGEYAGYYMYTVTPTIVNG